jgi:hypothetical protein
MINVLQRPLTTMTLIMDPFLSEKSPRNSRLAVQLLRSRINGKHKSIASNGGLNRLLAVAYLGVLFLYIRKQALAGFPCTWATILAVKTMDLGIRRSIPAIAFLV